MPTYLGLDFGGTKLAAGLADETGRLLTFERCPTDPALGPEGAIAAMRRLCARFLHGATLPSAVGISFGGPVDFFGRQALLSHHGPGWENYPLVDRINQLWACPVVMDNDANVVALGEARFGAGRGRRDILYVTVSTGIGAGIIVDGAIFRGSRGLAGEIGHTIVLPNGPRCPCGKRGCLEAVASGPSIARAYVERIDRAEPRITAEDVFKRAKAGDATAKDVLGQAIYLLGIGLTNAINLVDPEVVIVGGGVARAGDALFGPLREKVRAGRAPSPPGAVPILQAELDDRGGVLGAVALTAMTPSLSGQR